MLARDAIAHSRDRPSGAEALARRGTRTLHRGQFESVSANVPGGAPGGMERPLCGEHSGRKQEDSTLRCLKYRALSVYLPNLMVFFLAFDLYFM